MYANTYESMQKKTLCDAIRYLAHTTSSDVIFTSVKEQQPLKVFTNFMTSLIFDLGAVVYDTNSNNPIMVTSGADKLSKINEPDGAGRSKASLEELYQQQVEAKFPK